jgi:hypothetical protein
MDEGEKNGSWEEIDAGWGDLDAAAEPPTAPEEEGEPEADREIESDGPTRPGLDQDLDPLAEPIHFEEHKPAKEPTERHTRDTARLRKISESVEPVAEGEGAQDPSEPLVVRPPAPAPAPSPSEPSTAPGRATGRQILIVFAVLLVLAVAAVVAVVVTALG